SIESNQIHTVNAVAIQGSIAANQIGAVNATTIQGVIVSQQLADQIIDHISKLANVLRPIQMVHTGGVALPSPDFPPNSFYYWIEGHHFYQITPDGLNFVQNDNPQGTLQSFYWIGAINANQIIGLILAAQIDTITAGQITGSIQANQIGAVNASVIAGKVTATQIASVDVTTIQGLIQSGQIQNINAGQISGTIQGNQIANINANTINIGNFQVGGVNMAGSLYVYDNANNVIGEIGNLGATGGSYGGWFKVFGAGGTAYSNAPIYTDLAGNLFIRSPNLTNATLNNSSINNPTFNVGSGSATISTSPTTFDPTYSALALKNTQSPDMTSFVSRGLIIYYNNTKVGAFVRDPGGGFASLEFINGGGYVLISGNTGQVRADGGFTTAGHVGSTASYTLALAAGGSVTLQFRGGILAP
ncbi:MAG TPA: hypothetical protein VKG02_18850, partial [Blastocatellia bacterium]|nr:hypothetical protein [Blastocatellia bacterium]